LNDYLTFLKFTVHCAKNNNVYHGTSSSALMAWTQSNTDHGTRL